MFSHFFARTSSSPRWNRNRSTQLLQFEPLEERSNPSFTLDPTFGGSGLLTSTLGQSNSSWADVGVQPAGRVLIFTGFTDAPGNPSGLTNPSQDEILGLTSDGNTDTTFGSGGRIVLSGAIGGDMAVAPDGKIYVATMVNSNATVYRFNQDGSPDSTFGTDGVVIVDAGGVSMNVGKLALQPDGKVVLAGTSSQPWTAEYLAIRLNTDGSLDNSFSGNGVFQQALTVWNGASINAVTVAADGTLVISGSLSEVPIPGPPGTVTPDWAMGGFAVVELTPDGLLKTQFNGTGLLTSQDTSSNPLLGASELVSELDDTILALHGVSTVYRINLDESFDTSFGVQGAAAIPTLPNEASLSGAASMVLLPNGQIAVEVSAPTQMQVSVFNADGTLANSFADGAGSLPIDLGGNPVDFWNFDSGIAITPSGNLIVASTRSEDTASTATELNVAQLTGSTVQSSPFPSSYAVPAGAILITADVNGDGTLDGILVKGNTIQVINGADLSTLVPTFAPFPDFDGTLSVAAADVNGTGRADIIVGAGAGGGPVVAVFDGGTELEQFYAFDSSFRGGVSVAAGDVRGSGHADIIVGAGLGGGPVVAVFDGMTGVEVERFYAFDSSFRGGVSVAAGNVIGSSDTEIIVGAGPGGGPVVAVFDGKTGTQLSSFFAADPASRDGVNVAAIDLTGSGEPDIVVGVNPGGPMIEAYTSDSAGAFTLQSQAKLAFPTLQGGLAIEAGAAANTLAVGGDSGSEGIEEFAGLDLEPFGWESVPAIILPQSQNDAIIN